MDMSRFCSIVRQQYANVHFTIAVDFVLKDPREKDEDKKEELAPHRAELAVVPKPWNRSYVQSRNISMDILHVTNPCMLQVLELWHTSFG